MGSSSAFSIGWMPCGVGGQNVWELMENTSETIHNSSDFASQIVDRNG